MISSTVSKGNPMRDGVPGDKRASACFRRAKDIAEKPEDIKFRVENISEVGLSVISSKDGKEISRTNISFMPDWFNPT